MRCKKIKSPPATDQGERTITIVTSTAGEGSPGDRRRKSEEQITHSLPQDAQPETHNTLWLCYLSFPKVLDMNKLYRTQLAFPVPTPLYLSLCNSVQSGSHTVFTVLGRTFWRRKKVTTHGPCPQKLKPSKEIQDRVSIWSFSARLYWKHVLWPGTEVHVKTSERNRTLVSSLSPAEDTRTHTASTTQCG